MTSEFKTYCTASDQAFVDSVKKELEFALPDCSDLTVSDDGTIVAIVRNTSGTRSEVYIDNRGEVSRSTFCSEIERRGRYQLASDGVIRMVPDCRDTNNVKQMGSVNPAKLQKAKALIAGKRIKEIDDRIRALRSSDARFEGTGIISEEKIELHNAELSLLRERKRFEKLLR